MDNRVDSTTHLVANSASLPYLAAKMAAVAPAGMPVIMTATPAATESSPSSRLHANAAPGSSTSLKIPKPAVVLLIIVLTSTSARIVPIINIVTAELQFPILRTEEASTSGT